MIHKMWQRACLSAASVLLLSLAAAPASAQTYLTPHIGVAFSGSTDDSKLTYGGDLAFTGGLLGVSVDFGYTKDFFGESSSGSDNNVTTLMGNLMLISPRGKVRFYGSAGGGLLKTRVTGVDGFLDVSSNDWGVDAGAGVYITGGAPIGFRGDIRYFRRITDPEIDGEFDIGFGSLSFWRATAGVTFKF